MQPRAFVRQGCVKVLSSDFSSSSSYEKSAIARRTSRVIVKSEYAPITKGILCVSGGLFEAYFCVRMNASMTTCLGSGRLIDLLAADRAENRWLVCKTSPVRKGIADNSQVEFLIECAVTLGGKPKKTWPTGAVLDFTSYFFRIRARRRKGKPKRDR